MALFVHKVMAFILLYSYSFIPTYPHLAFIQSAAIILLFYYSIPTHSLLAIYNSGMTNPLLYK